MGMTSLEKEMGVLHCWPIGVTFSRVQEKSAIEQEDKVTKPAISKTDFFI